MNKNHKISIIIPTLNEEKNIASLINIINQRASSKNIAEIIVADSSLDKTAKKARAVGAKTVSCKKRQRASQLNSGAKIASGDILYFLHADSLPPVNFDKSIIQAIDNKMLAGCFRLQFDDKHWFLRALAWFTKFNWGFIRFGDQSLFIESKLFDRLGGYNENMNILEDLEIASRARKITRFKVLPSKVVTSARKYHEQGYFWLQTKYTLINIEYHLEKYLTLLKRTPLK